MPIGHDTVPVVAARTQERAWQSRVREYLVQESDTRGGIGLPVIDARQSPIPSGMPDRVRKRRRIHESRNALPGKRSEHAQARDTAGQNDHWQWAGRAPLHRHDFRTVLHFRNRAPQRRTPALQVVAAGGTRVGC